MHVQLGLGIRNPVFAGYFPQRRNQPRFAPVLRLHRVDNICDPSSSFMATRFTFLTTKAFYMIL
jgi:hypothetical protein